MDSLFSTRIQIGSLKLCVETPSRAAFDWLQTLLTSSYDISCPDGDCEWVLQVFDSEDPVRRALLEEAITPIVDPTQMRVWRYILDRRSVRNVRQFSQYLLLIATWWHTAQNGLCVHASCAADERGGFLFMGKGGAGKSTVARLSASVDRQVLGEDRALIIPGANGTYSLGAVPLFPPQLTTSPYLRPPLRAVFSIVQNNADYLRPLSQLETAQVLFRGVAENSVGGLLSSDVIQTAFHTCAAIARVIPGYELHFRKSPDFWKLIDAEFAD